MTQDNGGEQHSQSLTVSPQEETQMTQLVEEVFASVEDAQPIVEKKLQELGATGNPSPALKTALQSLWNYFEAIRVIRSEGDFARASGLLQSSAEGFNEVGRGELRDLSVGMGVYVTAVVELQAMNIGQGLELLAKVKEYLQSAGQYGGIFEPLIDQMQPDALFLAGVKAAMSLDHANAKILFDEASQAAERVSSKYYEEGQPLYYTFRGLGHFHKAYGTFFRATNEFSRFEYDKIAGQDLVDDAIQARDLLRKGDTDNAVVRNVLHLSEALIQLLEMLSESSKLMLTVLRSTFKPDLRTLARLRKKVQAARDSVSLAGPQAVGLVRYCDQLVEQIDNLERLAKPSKKDFGIFSGIVACVLFLPLFLVVSWANSIFNTGLEAPTLITTCVILALIGGFGFGAVKFKDLIFSTTAGKK